MATENKARTFRWEDATNVKIKEIGKLLNLNDTEVLKKAVDYLHANLKEVAEADFKARLSGLK
ncbi:hypothetical protein ACFQ4C_12125 [Larkinella insperata]|uniref:Uncharacterized protein n=1 Tax=Larkinella insperata TaxID=332158 RepID=A0ABW3Q5L2_9BACT|nr:hypothetical protein [Larkinella insperata]